jgi:hypothetical protein
MGFFHRIKKAASSSSEPTNHPLSPSPPSEPFPPYQEPKMPSTSDAGSKEPKMLSLSDNKRLKAVTALGKEEERKSAALEELTKRETRIFNKLTWQLREGVYNKATKEDRVEYLEKMYEGLPKKVQKKIDDPKLLVNSWWEKRI